ncbi:MAG: ABC transporter ATP-binding protein [Chloroflexota bacterium]
MMLNPRIFSLTSSVRSGVATVTLIGLLVTATFIGQGLLMAHVLTILFQREPLANILPFIGVILILMVLRAGLQWLFQIRGARTAATVKHGLRGHIYAHLLALGPGYLERARTGTVQSALVDGVEGLERYIGFYIPQIFIVLLVPALIVLYLATIDLLAAALILLSLIIVIAGPRLFKHALGDRADTHWQAYRDLNAQFLDSMQGMNTLKAFNASTRRGAELQRDAVQLYRATMGHMAISLIGTGITGLGMTAGSALVVGISALRLAQGAITVPELFIILFLTYECLRPLGQLNTYWHEGFMGLASAKGIFAVLDAQPEVTQRTMPHELETAGSPPLRPTVQFDNVAFAYNNGERPALYGLSFSVAPGETVALVGRSGSGKTTVVSLLLRYFDPQQGTILLDGCDLRDYPLETLRSMFAIVSQETYLFHGSVADNLRLAQPDASSAEIETATRAANAHAFISTLPQGYDTIIGERGLRLSGGERQRIAIARALLKDAPILILDEATSNVDAANEYAIQQALEQLMTNRTTLVIAHRLSTIANANRIVVLDQGVAIEVGQHRELLSRSGAYAHLVAAQA